jgi:hydroxymethylpyrimidine kinase/phosphomethylpyrimidine kinase
MRILCVAGLDPSGGAGLSADLRALEFLGLRCYPVTSVITVQNTKDFIKSEPVPAVTVEAQIDAAFAEEVPKAVKVGLTGNAETARMIARKLGDLPMVVDPVFRSSTGFELADDDIIAAYKDALIPGTTVLTPNAHEAGVLSDMDVTDVETAKEACLAISEFGPKAILVKGGHFIRDKGTDVLYFNNEFHAFSGPELPGDTRGTGCTYSSLIAGYLALGFEVIDAVRRAKSDMPIFLRSRPSLTDEETEVRLAVENAVSELVFLLPQELMAEVGNNIAYALDGARGPEGICSLDSRIILKGGRVVTLGKPVFGRDSHVGRVVLAAMTRFPDLRCAMNLRFSEYTLAGAEKAGLTVADFDRTEEPSETSSMSWGTSKALGQGRADLIFDRGSVGKEPMIRLLARDPEDLISKLTSLVGMRS